jgi:hypothetical protein
MWTLIIVLLVLWAILAIVGFVFEGLLWLAVIGAVLFVGTLIIGIIRQRARRTSAKRRPESACPDPACGDVESWSS